jgi:hypothetical protein
MTKRFYAAWACAVLLALALPVAIPYVLWPPGAPGPQGDPAAEFARRAEVQVIGSSHPIASLLPTSVRVEDTGQPWGPPHHRAEVIVRGPYGIPLGRAVIEGSEIGALEPDAGPALAEIAVLSGVAAVSLPFIAAWLRGRLRLRLQPAA